MADATLLPVLGAKQVRADGGFDASLAAWLPLVVCADPDAVQLYSLARPPVDPSLHNVPRERLEEMAQAIWRSLPRCVVEVF